MLPGVVPRLQTGSSACQLYHRKHPPADVAQHTCWLLSAPQASMCCWPAGTKVLAGCSWMQSLASTTVTQQTSSSARGCSHGTSIMAGRKSRPDAAAPAQIMQHHLDLPACLLLSGRSRDTIGSWGCWAWPYGADHAAHGLMPGIHPLCCEAAQLARYSWQPLCSPAQADT